MQSMIWFFLTSQIEKTDENFSRDWGEIKVNMQKLINMKTSNWIKNYT